MAAKMEQTYYVRRPSDPLRGLVSHLWLGRDNTDTVHAILPDGAVDLVFEIDDTDVRAWIYGTTTHRTEVELERGRHYLGVRFQPGQSRHFLAVAASELTDRRSTEADLLRLPPDTLVGSLSPGATLLATLEQALISYLSRHPPQSARIDRAIAMAQASRGLASIRALVECYGGSRRQFERVFLQTTGVSAKRFSMITRFQHARDLLAGDKPSLADIAAISGYADQSHMNRDFRRLAAVPPGRYLRSGVAFVQDTPPPSKPR
ncbi:MAG: AraC family transcriptional regulator [Ectothiorhodospiraceae bacterium]|nr:AraC family transcriptional regulator [Ectothiorhodospiraceae bacterium]